MKIYPTSAAFSHDTLTIYIDFYISSVRKFEVNIVKIRGFVFSSILYNLFFFFRRFREVFPLLTIQFFKLGHVLCLSFSFLINRTGTRFLLFQ